MRITIKLVVVDDHRVDHLKLHFTANYDHFFPQNMVVRWWYGISGTIRKDSVATGGCGGRSWRFWSPHRYYYCYNHHKKPQLFPFLSLTLLFCPQAILSLCAILWRFVFGHLYDLLAIAEFNLIPPLKNVTFQRDADKKRVNQSFESQYSLIIITHNNIMGDTVSHCWSIDQTQYQ